MARGQAKIADMTKKLDNLKEFDYFAPMFMFIDPKKNLFCFWKRLCWAVELLEAMPARDPPPLAD
jgi:hypothetical protein